MKEAGLSTADARDQPDKSMREPLPTSAISGFISLRSYCVSKAPESPLGRGRLIPLLTD